MRRSKRNQLIKSYSKYLAAALALAAVVFAGLELTNTTDLLHGSDSAQNSGPNTPKYQPNSQGSGSNNPPQSSDTEKNPSAKSSTPASTGAQLEISDRTTFASSHQAYMATNEQSVCVTNPGATCTIKFTKDGVIKALPIKVADSSGSAEWFWTPTSAHLSLGSWQIKAVATLNGQTKTAKDAYPLNVQP